MAIVKESDDEGHQAGLCAVDEQGGQVPEVIGNLTTGGAGEGEGEGEAGGRKRKRNVKGTTHNTLITRSRISSRVRCGL